MSNLPRLIWMEGRPRRPLCDVPWNGRLMVIANGDVAYCCYTDVYIGNLNRDSFTEIWNGPQLQRVRRQLAQHEYPDECKTLSCPLYNRHEYAHVDERMDGAYAPEVCGRPDPHAAIRAALEGTSVFVDDVGAERRIAIRLRYAGEPIKADVIAAVRLEDGTSLFLPGWDDFGVPVEVGLSLPDDVGDDIEIYAGPWADRLGGGGVELCVALFLSGSLPTQAANCYWSQCLALPPIGR